MPGPIKKKLVAARKITELTAGKLTLSKLLNNGI